MKKILIYLLMIFPLLANEKIVLLKDENSLFFYKSDGQAKGLYPKIFQDINQRENLDIKVRELKNNIDFLEENTENSFMYLVKAPKTNKFYNFINTFFYSKMKLYYLDRKEKNILDFYRKKIGVIKNSFFEREYKSKYSFLKNEFIDIKNKKME